MAYFVTRNLKIKHSNNKTWEPEKLNGLHGKFQSLQSLDQCPENPDQNTMERKIKSPNNLLDDDKDEDDADKDHPNFIQVGEVAISSKRPLNNPTKIISNILKDKTIKRYLGNFQNKKLIGIPNYID